MGTQAIRQDTDAAAGVTTPYAAYHNITSIDAMPVEMVVIDHRHLVPKQVRRCKILGTGQTAFHNPLHQSAQGEHEHGRLLPLQPFHRDDDNCGGHNQ